MQAVPPPANEAARLASLRALGLLDTAPEPEFDALVAIASRLCDTPISLLSLVDAHRQWFKANVGLPGASETPRDIAFCAHAILGDAPLVVPDAGASPAFASMPGRR
jgi:diguanylate cyclase